MWIFFFKFKVDVFLWIFVIICLDFIYWLFWIKRKFLGGIFILCRIFLFLIVIYKFIEYRKVGCLWCVCVGWIKFLWNFIFLLEGVWICFVVFFVNILLVWKVFNVNWVLGFLIDWFVIIFIVFFNLIRLLWVGFWL